MPSVPTEVAAEVVGRQLGLCAVGELPLVGARGWQWSIHHRLPQGMGGTSLPWWKDPDWLIAVCGHGTIGCHGWIESNRTAAIDLGYLLQHTIPATDPTSVLVVPRGVRCGATEENP